MHNGCSPKADPAGSVRGVTGAGGGPCGRGTVSSGVTGASDSCCVVNPVVGGEDASWVQSGLHDCPFPFPVVLFCIVNSDETYGCTSLSKLYAGLFLRLKWLWFTSMYRNMHA